MAERKEKLKDVDATLPVSQGLVNAISEIRGCTYEQANVIVGEMERDALDTRDVYYVLQEWCADRILVDKTPPYAWSIDTLRRAETIFKNARYVFLHRHPYATIASMVKESLNREWIVKQMVSSNARRRRRALEVEEVVARIRSEEDDFAAFGGGDDDGEEKEKEEMEKEEEMEEGESAAATEIARQQLQRLDPVLWDESDRLYATANANIQDFLTNEVSPVRWTRMAYEDFLRDPREELTRVLWHVLRLPFDDACLDPYSAENVATREGRQGVEGRSGMAAMDPRVLERRSIDASMANAWVKAPALAPLSTFAMHVGRELGYEPALFKEPTMRPGCAPEIIRLNRGVRGYPVVIVHDVLGEVNADLRGVVDEQRPAYGLRLTPAGLGLHDLEDLARLYAAAVMSTACPEEVCGDCVVIGKGRFGSALAVEVARQLGGSTVLCLEEELVEDDVDVLLKSSSLMIHDGDEDHHEQLRADLRNLDADAQLDVIYMLKPSSVTEKKWKAQVDRGLKRMAFCEALRMKKYDGGLGGGGGGGVERRCSVSGLEELREKLNEL